MDGAVVDDDPKAQKYLLVCLVAQTRSRARCEVVDVLQRKPDGEHQVREVELGDMERRKLVPQVLNHRGGEDLERENARLVDCFHEKELLVVYTYITYTKSTCTSTLHKTQK